MRHIGWDIGIAAVSPLVADALDATLVQQNYSRLIIDCNRTPGTETSMPEISERTPVPGNIGLNEGQKSARVPTSSSRTATGSKPRSTGGGKPAGWPC